MIAFLLGGICGVFLMCLCIVAGRGDDDNDARAD